MNDRKLTIISAVWDMAAADGRLHRREREVLAVITDAMGLTPEERDQLNSRLEPLDLSTLPGLLTERSDQLKLMELAVLVGLVDGVESPEEQERLRELAAAFRLGPEDIAGCLERARERYFALSRVWDEEGF